MIRLQFSAEAGIAAEAIKLYQRGWPSHVDALLPDGQFLGARLEGGVAVRPYGYAKFTRVEVIDLADTAQEDAARSDAGGEPLETDMTDAPTDPLFQAAQAIVYRHEGALSDNPNDPGGLTNMGIALRRHPDMTAQQIRDLTRAQADAIYYAQYWRPYHWDMLPKTVCLKAYDVSVDIGAVETITALQCALRACGQNVAGDGELGPVTVGAAHGALEIELLAAFKSELAAHYRVLAVQHPLLKADLPGWLNRAYE